MVSDNFQRVGSISNAHVGREFEALAQTYFANMGTKLELNFPMDVGFGSRKKLRKFDLGSEDPAILVECKSHRWTSGGNIPSAKITVWNEAMYYFHLAPQNYRKIFFVLRDFSEKRGCTLAEYYLRNYFHLVPDGVEVWEYDADMATATQIA